MILDSVLCCLSILQILHCLAIEGARVELCVCDGVLKADMFTLASSHHPGPYAVIAIQDSFNGAGTWLRNTAEYEDV